MPPLCSASFQPSACLPIRYFIFQIKLQVLNEEEKNRNGGFAELNVWGDNLLVLELGCPSLKINFSTIESGGQRFLNFEQRDLDWKHSCVFGAAGSTQRLFDFSFGQFYFCFF